MDDWSHSQYTTKVAQNLDQNQEAYVVYTPPGYDAKKPGGYPVLYLLHGWSETEGSWDAEGRANLILDRLLAEGKIVPMIVVMPLGYGDLRFVQQGFGVWQEQAKITENLELFSKMLLTEILPAAESEYNVAPGRENRAIAGLSMGGLEGLTIGMNHPETFAYVGGMSAAIFGGKTKEDDEKAFAQYIPDANGEVGKPETAVGGMRQDRRTDHSEPQLRGVDAEQGVRDHAGGDRGRAHVADVAREPAAVDAAAVSQQLTVAEKTKSLLGVSRLFVLQHECTNELTRQA